MTDQLKQLSEAATLANRLRGIYAIGPDVGGEPEFGHRDFGSAFTPRIQLEAADRIEALETQLTEAHAREAVAYEVVEAISAYETAETAAADTGSEDDYWFVFECWDAVQTKKAAFLDATDPAHTTTALEQIKQQARDEVVEAIINQVFKIPSRCEPISGQSFKYVKRCEVLAIIATLSADTQD